MSEKGTKTLNGDQSPIDIGSILARPVESSFSQPIFTPDNTENIVELEEEPETQPANEYQSQPYVNNGGGAGYEQQYQEEPQSLSPDDLAIITVNMVDGIQSVLFAFWRESRVFSEDELQSLGLIDKSSKTLYTEGSKEAILLAKYRNHAEAIKNLPFNEGEKKRLTDAAVIYSRTTQIKVSPFTGLLLAFSEVLGTRAIGVMGARE